MLPTDVIIVFTVLTAMTTCQVNQSEQPSSFYEIVRMNRDTELDFKNSQNHW